MSSNSNPNENLAPLLKDYLHQIYKFYLNEDFRAKVLDTCTKLSNDIFKKSNEKAFKHRQDGNQLFKDGKYTEALKHYSEGIKYAEHVNGQDSELCLLLGNRSAVFLKLLNYHSCLADVDYALKLCHTDKLKGKLNQRRQECVSRLQDLNRQREEEATVDSKLNEESQLKKAASDLKSMDIILKERPSRALLKEKHYYFNCFHCFKPLIQNETYYCLGCSQVQFCSYTCLDQSWQSGHSYFCLHLYIFNHLPFKDIFRYPPLLALLNLLSFDLDQIFANLRKGNLINWFGDLSEFSENEAENVKMAQNAAFLLVYLTNLKRLPPKQENIEWKYNIELFALLIMIYLQNFEKATTVITCVKLDEPIDKTEFKVLEQSELGYGIYPRLNSLKHACCPNAFISNFSGQEVTLRSAKDLAKDEVITIDHGINCKSYTCEERKVKLLDYYSITCKCEACLNGQEPVSKAYLCSNCSGPVVTKCHDCGQLNSADLEECEETVKSTVRNVRQASLLLIRSDPDLRRAEDYLLDSFRRLKMVLYPSNRHFLQVCEGLSYCYKKMRDYRLSYVYAKHALKCAEQDDHPGFNYFNTLLKLIQRQSDFINYVKRKGKENEKGYNELFKEALASIGDNISEAEKQLGYLTDKLDTEYFKKLLKQLNKY